MSVNFSLNGADLSSTHRLQGAVYTGPASYATGGDPIDPNTAVRMGKINQILGLIASNGTSTYLLWYNSTTGKIMWFVPSTNVEVAAAVNLSGFTARLLVVGR